MRLRSGEIVSRESLFTGDGHVRAASGLAKWRNGLAIVQDDTAYLEVRDETHRASVRLLPPEELATFEASRGTKALKPDFEAVFEHGGRLFAVGSGSTARRCRWAIWDGVSVRCVDASRWYAALEALPERTTELNVEGATPHGGRLVVALRSNGLRRGSAEAQDLLVSFDLVPLIAWLDGDRPDLPDPIDVVPLDLGALDGVRLTVTDLASDGTSLWFTAAAEASPDAVEDGEVRGSVVGCLSEGGAWVRLTERGAPTRDKVEGLVVDELGLWLVTDADSPEVPAQLLRVAWT